jgi:uncharacterized phage protein (TIGR01671 family)
VREIKFRAELKDSVYWVYGGGIIETNIGNMIISVDDGRPMFHIIKPETIGQFTGILDKNGKEIFEGDIVRRCAGYEGDTFENACNCLVEWDDGGFSLSKNGTAFIASLDSCEVHNRGLNVIGNRFENPELLEDKCQAEQAIKTSKAKN